MSALYIIKWTDEKGNKRKFRLVSRVSNKWREFGRILGITENDMDGWFKQHLAFDSECWIKTMKYWLEDGSEHYPVTWDGLVEMLEDVNLAGVAKELKQVLKCRM